MKTVFWGAGLIGRKYANYYKAQRKSVSCFIDNNPQLVDTYICGIPVKSVRFLTEMEEPYEIILTCANKNIEAISNQLNNMGITNFRLYDAKALYTFLRDKPRIISYCHSCDMEDVILYHIFKDFEDIFYIDVGSNDPCIYSVTKFLYDSQKAHGINIDPQKWIIDLTTVERPRDINLCIGLGDTDRELAFFDNGGIGAGNTIDPNNRVITSWEERIPITTLNKVCDQYVHDKEISFLKIDVEGYEKQVLMGANFETYRPLVIVMESTLPNTMIPCHEGWEHILLDAGYVCSYMHGVNRYYVRDDRMDLDARFRMIDDFDCVYDMYEVYQAEFKHM